MPKTGAIDEIVDSVLIGDVRAALDADLLRRSGVTHVVNAVPEENVPEIASIAYHYVDCADDRREDLSPHFAPTTAFISHAVKLGGKTFIHCRWWTL